MSDRRVLVKVFAARYQAARKKERSQILDESVEMSGYTRLRVRRSLMRSDRFFMRQRTGFHMDSYVRQYGPGSSSGALTSILLPERIVV